VSIHTLDMHLGRPWLLLASLMWVVFLTNSSTESGCEHYLYTLPTHELLLANSGASKIADSILIRGNLPFFMIDVTFSSSHTHATILCLAVPAW
jgi:hypothetical protein